VPAAAGRRVRHSGGLTGGDSTDMVSEPQPLWLTFIVAFIFMNVLLIGMAYMT
jgi:hypothetical protein